MRRSISVAEVLNAGVELTPDEAIAIVQQLIHSPGGSSDPRQGTRSARPTLRSDGRRPARADQPKATGYGPPAMDNVLLAANGSVSCAACEATPAVSEIGRLLQQMLSDSGVRIPGSLRYTVARALLEVDAPPFDSLSDFSEALERYERGDRADHVRRVLERARAALGGPFDVRSPAVDRRRATAEIFELRRQLRESDERLYDQQRAIDALVAAAGKPPARTRVSAIAAGVAIGMTLVGTGELMHTSPAGSAAVQSASVATRVATAQEDDHALDPAPAAVPVIEQRETPEPDTIERSAASVERDAVAKDADVSRLAPRRRTPSASPPIANLREGAAVRSHRPNRGVLDRLHLRWLRTKVVIRVDDL